MFEHEDEDQLVSLRAGATYRLTQSSGQSVMFKVVEGPVLNGGDEIAMIIAVPDSDGPLQIELVDDVDGEKP